MSNFIHACLNRPGGKKNIIFNGIVVLYCIILPSLIAQHVVFGINRHLIMMVAFPVIYILINNLKVAFWVFIYVLPFSRPCLIGGDITPAEFMGLFVFLLYISQRVFLRFKEPAFRLEEKYLIGFYILCLFSIVQSIYIPDDYIVLRGYFINRPFLRSIGQCFKWGIVVAIYFATFKVIVKEKIKIEKITKAYLYLSTILCVLSIISLIMFYSWEGSLSIFGCKLVDRSHLFLTFPRISGVFFEPAWFAHYLTPSILFLLVRMIQERNNCIYLLFILHIFIFIFTFSRGAFLGLIVAIAILWAICLLRIKDVCFKKMFKRLSLLIIIMVLIFGSLFLFLFLNNQEMVTLLIDNRISALYQQTDWSMIQKLEDYKMALKVIEQYPIFGVGLGNLWFHSPLYRNYIEYFSMAYGINTAVVTNLFLFIGVELGISGLLIWLIFLCIIFWKLIVRFFKGYDEKTVMILWSMVSLISLLIQFNFICTLFPHFFFLLGVFSALCYKDELLIR